MTDISQLENGQIVVRVARRNRVVEWNLPYDVEVGDWITVLSATSSIDLWTALSWNSGSDGSIIPILSPESSQQHIVGEDLTSQVDGAETVFTTLYEFEVDSEAVYLSGLRQRRVQAYAAATGTVSFVLAPPTGSAVLIDYIIASYNCGWGIGPWGAMPWGC